MKNLTLAAALLVSVCVSAQPLTQIKSSKPVEEKKHYFGIGLEPHWLLIGGLGAKADARVSDNVAIEIGGMYIPPRQNTMNEEDKKGNYGKEDNYLWSVYEIYFGTRVMLMGDYDHHGLFVTPAIGYTGAKISDYGSRKLEAALDVPEARLTVGYQFVVANFLRFAAGAGWRVMGQNDVVVGDAEGNEVYRQRSSTMNGLVIEGHAAILF
jgi:hypothetical protein